MFLRQNHSVGGIIEIPNERMKTVHSCLPYQSVHSKTILKNLGQMFMSIIKLKTNLCVT